MHKIGVRILLAAIVVSLAVLAATPAPVSTENPEPGRLHFSFDCKQTAAPVGGGIGEVVCTLSVSGLPDPLEDVKLTLFHTDDERSGPGQASVSPSIPFSDLPGAPAGGPVQVSRRLPTEPPPAPPIVPRVPEPPPKVA